MNSHAKKSRRTHDTQSPTRTPPDRTAMPQEDYAWDNVRHFMAASDVARDSHLRNPQMIMQLQRTLGNRATQRLLIQRENALGESAEEKVENKTGYLGMNPAASREARALKKRLKDDVIISLNDPKLEADLKDEAGIVLWVTNNFKGAPSDTIIAAYDILLKADPPARDQLGAVMKMFYGAENGQYNLERLVMSGHSNGIALWGEAEEASQTKSQILLDSDMTAITKLFPTATGQVQDVMFSACWSVVAIELVEKLFPNVMTIWAYTGSSPSIKSGSISHILSWEKNTRGDKTLDKGDKRGKSALWVRGEGFLAGDPAEIPHKKVEDAYINNIVKFTTTMDGTVPIDRPFFNAFYTVVQVAKIHPGVSGYIRKEAESLIPKVLRLRYWKLITQTFAKEHEDAIKNMYKGLGLNAAAIGTMTRPELVAEVKRLEAAFKDDTPDDVKNFVLNVLKKGLVDLDDKVIPNTWI